MDPWVASTRNLWIGDSISTVFNGSSSCIVPVSQGLRPAFIEDADLLAPATLTQTVPRIIENAVAGRSYGDISPAVDDGTMATFLRQYGQRFTDFVFQLGINDALKLFLVTLTVEDLELQVGNAIANCRTQSPGCDIRLVGPWCHDPIPSDLAAQIVLVNGVLESFVADDVAFILWSDIPNTGQTHPDDAQALALSVPILASIKP